MDILKFIPWFRSLRKANWARLKIIARAYTTLMGEISVVREADEDMEEEIVEDSDKEDDEIWSLTAII